ncbi:MAG: hypothetical protein AAFX50_22310, partial [Acidobacteriota bacterium]
EGDLEGGCACLWVAEVEQDSPKRTRLRREGEDSPIGERPDWQELEERGPGANLVAGAQILGGDRRAVTLDGESRIGLHLRCFRFLGWTPVAWSGLDVEVPQLVPCEGSCSDASIRSSASAAVSVEAKALSTRLHGALASSTAAVEYFVNDAEDPLGRVAAEAEVTRLPGGVAKSFTDRDGAAVDGDLQTTVGRDAGLRFHATAAVEICLASGSAAACPAGYLRPFYDDGSWAYGQAEATSWGRLDGLASCVQPLSGFIALERSASSGSKSGVVIVPWRP